MNLEYYFTRQGQVKKRKAAIKLRLVIIQNRLNIDFGSSTLSFYKLRNYDSRITVRNKREDTLTLK